MGINLDANPLKNVSNYDIMNGIRDRAPLSYQERMATSQAPLLYAFAVFVMFLYLAALYESWPIPIAILLVLPLGAVGGVLALRIREPRGRREADETASPSVPVAEEARS